jgi:hypothetical protein
MLQSKYGQAIAGNHSQGIQSFNSEGIPTKLTALIEAVRALNFPDQDEVVDDLDKVQQLASGKQSEGIIKKIQSRARETMRWNNANAS